MDDDRSISEIPIIQTSGFPLNVSPVDSLATIRSEQDVVSATITTILELPRSFPWACAYGNNTRLGKAAHEVMRAVRLFEDEGLDRVFPSQVIWFIL